MNSGLDHLHVIELGVESLRPWSASYWPIWGDGSQDRTSRGEMARRRGPFRGHQVDPEASGTFLYLNSNKRSVVLDLSQAAGRARLEELVRQADLLLHNFTPQEMAANGLDYAHYRQLNARLVMLSITPFGLSGPHRDYAACDLTLYHGSGLGWLCLARAPPCRCRRSSPSGSTPTPRPPCTAP